MFKFVIVGAGFAGSVLAERISQKMNQKVLVIDKRPHLGGNCYDYRDANNILVHKYGPHLFHTNNKEVFEYLSNFTQWWHYQHKVLASIDGKKVPLPFNFNSIDILFPDEMSKRLQQKLLAKYPYGSKVPILELKKNDDVDVQFLANFIYEKVFLHYTAKQWGKKPEEIDSEVTARVPVFIGRDDRYFQDMYQAVPEDGYTKLFENMLFHPNIKLLLNTDFREILHVDIEQKKIYFMGNVFDGILIFTGMIDELFNYHFGMLPYRSLDFKLANVEKEFFQEAATVNYPNEYDFTRITEYKHIYPVKSNNTSIVYEYPKKYEGHEIPYYPLFSKEGLESYEKYMELSSKFKNIVLVGRLAEYKYYDMDDVVKRALEIFGERIC